MRNVLFVGLSLTVSGAFGQAVKKVSVPPPVNMTRAELYVLPADGSPSAVAVLCPGFNGDGRGLLDDEQWREFAKARRLTLAALSFASPPELFQHGRGYYYAGQGSGDALLACLKKAGADGVPLLLYGFSGGAHFTARFAEWQPERVLAWCAYSAAWWDEPIPNNHASPGIVACGADDERYQATFDYFQQGRRLGNRWTWVGLPKVEHQPSTVLEQFAREYFAAVLKLCGSGGVWADRRGTVADGQRYVHDPQWSWLPEQNLLANWRRLADGETP